MENAEIPYLVPFVKTMENPVKNEQFVHCNFNFCWYNVTYQQTDKRPQKRTFVWN